MQFFTQMAYITQGGFQNTTSQNLTKNTKMLTFFKY